MHDGCFSKQLAGCMTVACMDVRRRIAVGACATCGCVSMHWQFWLLVESKYNAIALSEACGCAQEISVARVAMNAGGKLQWQRIMDQPLKLKASVDYDEALHGDIRRGPNMLSVLLAFQ